MHCLQRQKVFEVHLHFFKTEDPKNALLIILLPFVTQSKPPQAVILCGTLFRAAVATSS